MRVDQEADVLPSSTTGESKRSSTLESIDKSASCSPFKMIEDDSRSKQSGQKSSKRSKSRSHERCSRKSRSSRDRKRRSSRSTSRSKSPRKAPKSPKRDRSPIESYRKSQSVSAQRSISPRKAYRSRIRRRSPIESPERSPLRELFELASRGRSPRRSDSYRKSHSVSPRRSILFGRPRRRSPRSPSRVDNRRPIRRTPRVSSRRFDAHSPLRMYHLFEDLDIATPILEGIQKMNIIELNRFQKAVLPSLLNIKRNFYIQAKPSFGKKISYLITAMQSIDQHFHYPQALIVVPTEDLALRLIRIGRSMSAHTRIEMKALIDEHVACGGKIGEQLLICTSGALYYCLTRYQPFDLDKIKLMVFDELPILTAASRSHFYIRELMSMKKDCRTIYFSVDFDGGQEIRSIKRFSDDLRCINLLEKSECLASLLQFYVYCKDMNQKNDALKHIFLQSSVDRSIVFVNDNKGAARVESYLYDQGYRTFLLTCDVDLNKRMDEVRYFEKSKNGILVITYPLSVGLDLSRVHLVINYDLPMSASNFFFEYFYRVEECTRCAKNGFVVNLVDSSSKEMALKLERYFGFRMSKLHL